MAKVRRYISDRDPKGVTPFQFHSLPLPIKANYVLRWIRDNFQVVHPGQEVERYDLAYLKADQEDPPGAEGEIAEEIGLRVAISLFPERITRDDAELIREILVTKFRPTFKVYEHPRKITTFLYQARNEYRTRMILEAVQNFKWLDPKTCRRMSPTRLLDYIEVWLHTHFIRKEETTRAGETNLTVGYPTVKLLEIFPYHLSPDEFNLAAEELNTEHTDPRHYVGHRVYWEPRNEHSYEDASTLYSNWHHHLLDADKSKSKTKVRDRTVRVERRITRKKVPEQGTVELVLRRLEELNGNISRALQYLPPAPLPGEAGHNEYAAGQSEDPGLQARHAVEAIKDEVNKPEPDKEALKEKSGLLKRLVDGAKRKLGLMADEAAKELAKRGTGKVLDEVVSGGASSMANGAWTQALPYLEAIVRTLKFW